MGSKTKREVVHLPAPSTKETVSYVLGRHNKNQKAADILGRHLTRPKTRNGKQSVHRLSHSMAFNVLWIQSILCRLGRSLVWGLHASQASGAGHSSFSILYSPASASQLWTWHSQLPVFRMLCPRLCATVSFLPFRFDFKCQLFTSCFHFIPFPSPRSLFQITFATRLSSQSCRTLSLLGVSFLPEMPVPGYVMIPGTL